MKRPRPCCCALGVLAVCLAVVTSDSCGMLRPGGGIVGKWSRLDETWPAQKDFRGLAPIYTVALEFHEDGSYQITNEESGKYHLTGTGRYRVVKEDPATTLILGGQGVDLLNVRVEGYYLGFHLPEVHLTEASYTMEIENDKLTLKNSDIGESAFLKLSQ